jgi:hypothetical protein
MSRHVELVRNGAKLTENQPQLHPKPLKLRNLSLGEHPVGIDH